jgi:hypothetical protein
MRLLQSIARVRPSAGSALRISIYAVALLWAAGLLCCPSLVNNAAAQTNISGDISGTVTDPTGAAIAGASVTITSKATGAVKTVTSGGHGEYRVPLLGPGDYALSASAPGFQGAKTTLTVSAGEIASGDIKLEIGKATTVVDVAATEPLLHTQDAQISTSFSMEQVQALPNPGNDLTFIAQTSPGAVMNTMSGQGNFSVFGLPATSNTFTVNGGYQNDPFLNLNNSGATNLLLGNNDVADVTVTSNAYDAAFGGLGGAQVNEISRSGGNSYHGNVNYWWNGRTMNANDWFNNAQNSPRPFDNVNQYAAAVGGPIVKDKAFWFLNYEGLRVVLPSRDQVYAPSTAFQKLITGAAVAGGVNPDLPQGNLAANGNTAEVPFYNQIFSIYNNAPGFTGAGPDVNDPNLVSFSANAGNFTHEYLVSGRTDFNLGVNDKAFVHFKVDKGLQATFTSLVNPLFNADSPQPQYGGEFQETHTFTPALTNQFLFAAQYYRAIFIDTNAAAANALSPLDLIFINSDLANNGVGGAPGGENTDFPQGRTVTNYQFADDLSYSRGNHTVKVGWEIRRDDITDYDPQIGVLPLTLEYLSSFGAGYGLEQQQSFPTRLTQPIALYNMGMYVQDQWKALSNLTITAGLRLEHNSNPTCLTTCFSYANGPSAIFNTDPNTPYNQLYSSGNQRAFPSLQTIGYEPRIGFAWLPAGPGSKTTVRGGFGLFVDSFPGTVADSILENAPTSAIFTTFNGLLDPSQPGSNNALAAASNTAFTSAFGSGGSYTSIFGNPATNGGLSGPSLLTPAQHIYYPTYDLYSLGLEQQITRSTVISLTYSGNHGYHEPVVNNSVNAANDPAVGDPNFTGLPHTLPNPSFGGQTVDYAGASSNYNGVIGSVTNRNRYLTLQFNYAYSHALDEISNGGILSFSGNSDNPSNPNNLAQSYGNADYDTRQYVSGSYVFTVPHFGGPRVVTDGWELAGTVFHHDGYPVSILDSAGGSFATSFGQAGNYGGPLLAQQTGTGFATHCGGESHTIIAGNSCPFAADFAPATDFGQSRRNQIFGGNFTDSDLDVTKGFKVPGLESGQLKVGAQFFNLFNHPNFAQPYNDVEAPATLGQSHNLQSTPTSILGSFLGGDASPRLVQLKAVFTF